MSTDAEGILGNLTGDLAPIHQLALRYRGEDETRDPDSNALLLSHRPRIGELAYAIAICPGVNSNILSAYEKIHGIAIPSLYRSVLSR